MLSSQSSLRPLQISTVEPVVSLHLSAPLLHEYVPSRQKSLSSPSHCAPISLSSTPSAVAGLQSSSTPLHSSRSSPVVSEQPSLLPVHWITPSAHRSLSSPSQSWPRVGSSLPSGVAGLQSSS